MTSTHKTHPFSSAQHRIPAPLCRAHSTGRSESSGRRLVKAGRLAPQAKILRSTVDCSCQNPHLSLLQHTLAALPSAAAPSRPRLLLIRSAPAHTDLYIYILTCACELTRRWTQRTAHAGQHGAARGSTGHHTAAHGTAAHGTGRLNELFEQRRFLGARRIVPQHREGHEAFVDQVRGQVVLTARPVDFSDAFCAVVRILGKVPGSRSAVRG